MRWSPDRIFKWECGIIFRNVCLSTFVLRWTLSMILCSWVGDSVRTYIWLGLSSLTDRVPPGRPHLRMIGYFYIRRRTIPKNIPQIRTPASLWQFLGGLFAFWPNLSVMFTTARGYICFKWAIHLVKPLLRSIPTSLLICSRLPTGIFTWHMLASITYQLANICSPPQLVSNMF